MSLGSRDSTRPVALVVYGCAGGSWQSAAVDQCIGPPRLRAIHRRRGFFAENWLYVQKKYIVATAAISCVSDPRQENALVHVQERGRAR